MFNLFGCLLKFKLKKVLFVNKLNPDIKFNNQDLFLFTKTIDQIIYTEFPKLKEFNSYLKKIAEICSFLNNYHYLGFTYWFKC